MRTNSGFTIIELLIAAAVLTVVLSIATSYLSTEAAAARVAQARNDVQDRVRLVMQLVEQDLQLAGSSRYVDSSNGVVSLSWTSCSSSSPCVNATNSGTKDAFSVRYITSLQSSTAACREVEYRFNGSDLERRDLSCGSTATSTSYAAVASNILALNILYVCSDGRVMDTASCPTSPANQAYPRSARISLVAQSSIPTQNSTGSTYTLTLSSGSTNVTCPIGYICSSSTQEIPLPNLR